MKICHIALHFAEYGYRLASACAERHEVLFIVNRQRYWAEMGKVPLTSKQGGFEVILIQDWNIKNPRMLISAFQIWNAVRKFKPDVIHIQESFRDYFMLVLPFLRSYPLVLTIHDHVPHSGNDAVIIIENRFGRYRNHLRRRAHAVIVHGEKIREETEMLLPWLRGRIFFIPHGVLGEPHRSGNTGWRAGRVLFFGRVEEYKGLGFFLDALDILRGEGTAMEGVIAGSGTDLNRYRDRISKSPHVTLIDRYIRPEEIPSLFLEANAVILPYTDATQSGVAAYALRFGRPMVATSVGSLPETVRHGINGLIVPPRDANALAAAIRSIITNPELAVRMSAEAARLADNEFSWQVISQRSEQVYQEVIAVGRKLP